MPIKTGRDYKCSIYAGSQMVIPKIDDKPEALYDIYDAKRGQTDPISAVLSRGQSIRTNF